MDTSSIFAVQKVQKRTTEAQAADRLRDAIMSGDIPLGARLTEIQMSEQVGVSRGTIRTAFHQLVQEGLLVQVPYTGWTVMTLSAQDAWELYTLRASLEALASRLVAQQIKDATTASGTSSAITTAFSRLKAACSKGNKRGIAQEDMNLHKAIVLSSNHRRLIEQYSLIEHQVRLYIRSSDALVLNPDEIVEQHDPIVRALLEGQVDAAVDFAAKHNELEGAILVEHLRQTEQN
ncbi:GntR family transcriptional regulator [Shinella sp. DD12]|uniref:GntR family transcriptional regulator n=1 Tax=Shinella sp. DD12 TaxID=1410620 RepID=UPI000437C560|nr:GntR family transcriptional regulator [Shinella sp. DD12]EYR77682.1 transcriptional regulator [Shinella sp. DD12]